MNQKGFRWLLPGEGRVAGWARQRVQKVQGDSRDLVAGAYLILAAMWGSVGGLIIMAGIFLDATSTSGSAGSLLLLIGIIPLAIGAIRIMQSRASRL